MKTLTQERKLIKIVNSIFEVDIRSRKRNREIVDARGVFYKILYDEGFSKSHIARILEYSHATVIFSLKTLPFILNQDIVLKDKYNQCRKEFLDMVNPVYLLNEDELIIKVIMMQKEIDALKKENISLHSERQTEKKYEPLFSLIKERVPKNKITAFKTRLNTLTNGIYN